MKELIINFIKSIFKNKKMNPTLESLKAQAWDALATSKAVDAQIASLQSTKTAADAAVIDLTNQIANFVPVVSE